VKRSKHSLSHYQLATFDMGELVPVACLDVLPGDSIRMSTSALIRLSPLMTPVMHPVSVRIHHWFVPYRVLWDGWEDFITGIDGATPPPQLSITPNAGALGDYLGFPPEVAGNFNAFPVNAYNLIWNEFYRDQDLQNERGLSTMTLANVAWEKDYFTAARPWSQKGAEVTMPLGVSAPVVTDVNPHGVFTGHSLILGKASDGTPISNSGTLGVNATSQGIYNASGITSSVGGWLPVNLITDLTSATPASINDLRLAFALQRYQEARAQYGSRYTEYLRYLGVRSSDARLQRPEYLGGGKSTISFSEILRTGNAETDTAPIGELKGHGMAALRTRRFVRFFEEHGVVLSLASIRPRSIYQDGLHRMHQKVRKEDFYQRELEQIGQQTVTNREVYAAHTAPNGTFGYQDRYSEYRHEPSKVSGDFRTTLNDWHLARQFSADPALNASFIECNPSKRIFAEQTNDAIWAMFSHSIQARRLVGNRTIGRIV